MRNINELTLWDKMWGNTNPLNQYNYNALLGQQGDLANQLANLKAQGLDTSAISSQLDQVNNNITNLNDLASFVGTDPSQMSPAQAMMAQKFVDNNTGLTGFVNNNFGGWGNVMQGIGQIANLFSGMQAYNLAKDQLALQQDAFNYNKALTTRNINDQAKMVNDRRWDILQSRGWTQSGNTNAFKQQYEDRKLDENFKG